MSVFLVFVRDDEKNEPARRMEPYYGCALEPPEEVWCADIVIANSRAQAKSLFLREWTQPTRNPVYDDDWQRLRVRLLTHDESATYDQRWFRVHEVLDHGGKPCDCPVEKVA